MKKTLIILITIATLITCFVGCSDEAAKLTALIYNYTTMETIEVNNGETVSITGYMSMSSPLDESMAYIMPQPFMTNPDVYGNATPLSGSEEVAASTFVPTMVAVYPPTGSKIHYTEKCVTVTGTIVYKEITDNQKVSYPFYLMDCSYVTYDDNGLITEYNNAIDSGSLVAIDEWLTAIYNGMLSPTTAVEVSSATHSGGVTEKLTGDCPNIKKLQKAVEELNVIYNEWVASSPTEVTESLALKYEEVGSMMVEWLGTIKTRGDEINENTGNTKQP